MSTPAGTAALVGSMLTSRLKEPISGQNPMKGESALASTVISLDCLTLSFYLASLEGPFLSE